MLQVIDRESSTRYCWIFLYWYLIISFWPSHIPKNEKLISSKGLILPIAHYLLHSCYFHVLVALIVLMLGSPKLIGSKMRQHTKKSCLYKSEKAFLLFRPLAAHI